MNEQQMKDALHQQLKDTLRRALRQFPSPRAGEGTIAHNNRIIDTAIHDLLTRGGWSEGDPYYRVAVSWDGSVGGIPVHTGYSRGAIGGMLRELEAAT